MLEIEKVFTSLMSLTNSLLNLTQITSSQVNRLTPMQITSTNILLSKFCKSNSFSHIWLRLLSLLIVGVFGVAEWVLIQYAKKHLWIIPTVILFNIVAFWLILNRIVLKSIIFPYAQSYISNQITKQLNEKYCQELITLVESCQQAIKEMLKQDYQPVQYKELLDGSNRIKRMAEFVEKFVPANRILIEDHKSKCKRGKRTSRFKISREFEEMTDILEKMLHIFVTVSLKPINSGEEFLMSVYYQQVSEFTRVVYDQKATKDGFPIRSFPLAKSEQSIILLKSFDALAIRFIQLATIAPYPIPIPRCLSCCCRGKRRTSCGLFYKLLFGETKQLGIIL